MRNSNVKHLHLIYCNFGIIESIDEGVSYALVDGHGGLDTFV